MTTRISIRAIIPKIFCLCVFLLGSIPKNHAQPYIGLGPAQLWELTINSCASGCSAGPYVYSFVVGHLTFAPNGDFFVGDGTYMWQVDPVSGFNFVYFDSPSNIEMKGLVTLGNDIFYSIGDTQFNGDSLYEVNVSTGIITNLGSTGYECISDLTVYNGEVYFITNGGLIRLNTITPSSSEWVVSISNSSYLGLTASHFCNNLLGINGSGDTNSIDLINIVDGTITQICTSEYWEPYDMFVVSSMLEFADPAPCTVMVDLDCDGSNSIVEFNCLDINGVLITDSDIALFADDWITEITITIASPIIDAPYEILVMTGSIPNIDVSDSGTSMITLTNAGGATLQDFKDALQLIVYKNLSENPTGGIRTIEVQFTTASGTMSNVAEYLIDVSELAHIPVELGPDLLICEGTTTILDPGNSGATFEWSTGASSQTITVDESGEYIVTVSDGVNCPNQDTVLVDIVPVISVSLTGDAEICDNETANLVINTNTPFPLTVEINADPGSPFIFTDVTGDYAFTDFPSYVTEYTITNVTPSQDACIEIIDPSQVIEVFPAYVQEQEVSLCDGDSIWLGFFWESDAGVYENLLQTEYGCDSFVTTYITILPAEHIFLSSTTCDSVEAGVFYQYLPNPNGCDTVVQTTVFLLPSDTTAIHLTSCNMANTGVSILTLTNQEGCDSLVITTTDWIPPSDTTTLHQLTCDTTQLGVFEQISPDQVGCDSLIITTVSLAPNDTTHIASTSCDTASLGVFETLLSNQQGCDSLVITTVSPGMPDTTLQFTTSCDSASLGVFTTNYTTAQSCDSTVISTVSYSAQDSVFITAGTCNPNDAGVFTSTYTNQFGCDSIVTETVSLLPSDDVFIQSATCDPASAGTFITTLTNQHGCDSTITETVALNPSDEIFLLSTTCNSSEAGVFITSLINQYGCDSVITETISLLPSDSTSILFQTCDPAQVGRIETLYSGQDGCDSLVIESTTLYSLPELMVQSGVDYNGFDISCAGEADGSAIATVNGIPPYTYLWSTNDTDQMITGLSAGDYAVSITDGNGCMTEGVITLTEPEVFMIAFEVSEPDCFDQQLGSITVVPSGGVSPYTYSIDGQIFQSSPDFTGLGEGIYQVTSLDANDCITTEIISIDVPLMVSVELGDNQVISLGDSALLQAIINLPFDSLASILWTGLDSTDCPNCLTQLVAPIITTAYSVSVTSVDGCADKDSLTVVVSTDHEIYVPNIFSPNGDGVNDELIIHAGDGVEEIMSFAVYDRWGNMVFLAEHILPNDPGVSWDGKRDGKTLNPGVFAYKLVARFEDGKSEVRYGDITLLR